MSRFSPRVPAITLWSDDTTASNRSARQGRIEDSRGESNLNVPKL
jgi:hypothetical protein